LYALYSCLEAVFGGYRDEGRMGGSLTNRILVASEFGSSPIDGLERFLSQTARSLRNQIAHGAIEPYSRIDFSENIRLLRALLRPSLQLALRTTIIFPKVEEELRSHLGPVRRWGAKTALNYALGLASRGIRDPLNLITAGVDPHAGTSDVHLNEIIPV
jgi:hypothetical protein